MSLKIRFQASFDTFCAKHKGARSKDIFGRKWQFFRLFVRLVTFSKGQTVRVLRHASDRVRRVKPLMETR